MNFESLNLAHREAEGNEVGASTRESEGEGKKLFAEGSHDQIKAVCRGWIRFASCLRMLSVKPVILLIRLHKKRQLTPFMYDQSAKTEMECLML